MSTNFDFQETLTSEQDIPGQGVAEETQKVNFDYQGAKKAGYSDEEISGHLKSLHPKFDYDRAIQSGYSASEVNEYLTRPPERGFYETYVERPVQTGVAATLSGIQALPRTAFDFLKSVAEATGGSVERFEKAPEWLKEVGRSFPTFEEAQEIRREGGAPTPEGSFEKGVEKFGRFVGEAPAFGGVGGVKGIASLAGLAGGLQYAEEAELGPFGQVAVGVLGAALPGAATGTIKSLGRAIKEPSKTLGKGVGKLKNTFSNAEKRELSKRIIKDARDSGIELDLGTITNNNLIKSAQAKLASSGLTGKPLDEFKKRLSGQIVNQYKGIAETIGKAEFETLHDAGLALKTGVEVERKNFKDQLNRLYKGAKERLKDKSTVKPSAVVEGIKDIEREIKPGNIKSAQQKAVLNVLEDIKKDVLTRGGKIKKAGVKALINDKVALHEIINYEVEGGVKNLLKKLAKQIDFSIQSYGSKDPLFKQIYKKADREFANFANDFRNKNLKTIFKSEDPKAILSKMNTVKGIRDVEKALSRTDEGKKLFKDLKRFKLDQIFEKNLISGTNDQIQIGKFASTLKKANNKEIVKELLGKNSGACLENLIKNADRLADSANKFYNSSQTATSLTDLAVASKLMNDISQLLQGNPLPFAKSGSVLFTTKQLSKLLANPVFLKAVEDSILSAEKGSIPLMKKSGEALLKTATTILREAPEITEEKNS